ncbi:hypothetical protein SCHPADRAFT_374509 [Schizopora paradoxa]|uniref:Uncharacterized protein n=1 Tax=Schizopora paradoxa TaxID=27342 RepID=A0A0H2S8I0_9AGAM|nr:hypothetical protein SCHPADRAFT_374509 [Schizopora paradoxa]
MILYQPLAIGIPLTVIPNCIIALRIYALYARSKSIAGVLFVYILGELAVGLWIYLTPSVTQVDLIAATEQISPLDTNTPSLHSCLAIVSLRLSLLQTASLQIMQSLYNFVALSLILFKTAKGRGIVGVIAKQGLIYYVLNFCSVISWTLMLILAPPGLKYTLAGPALGFGSMSTAKLTLHIRAYCMPQSEFEEVHIDRHVMYRLERKRSWVGATTFEVSGVGEDRDEDSLASIPVAELTAKDIPRIVRDNIRGIGEHLPRKLRNVSSVSSD